MRLLFPNVVVIIFRIATFIHAIYYSSLLHVLIRICKFSIRKAEQVKENQHNKRHKTDRPNEWNGNLISAQCVHLSDRTAAFLCDQHKQNIEMFENSKQYVAKQTKGKSGHHGFFLCLQRIVFNYVFDLVASVNQWEWAFGARWMWAECLSATCLMNEWYGIALLLVWRWN